MRDQQRLLLDLLGSMLVQPETPPDVAPLRHWVDWVRAGVHQGLEGRAQRVRSTVDALSQDATLCRQVTDYLVAYLGALTYRHTLSELGMLDEQTFLQTLGSRLFQRVLPVSVPDGSLQHTLGLLFTEKEDPTWLASVPADLWVDLGKVALWNSQAQGLLPVLWSECLEATELLSVRVAGLGANPELLQSMPTVGDASPFVEQLMEFKAIKPQALELLHNLQPNTQPAQHLDVLLDQCEMQVRKTFAQAKNQGMSVQLVSHLVRLQQHLKRMRELLTLTGLMGQEPLGPLAVEFVVGLVGEEHRKHSVLDVWRSLTKQLAFRITEYQSQTGEHYVTETRAEYWAMARAAAGAGLVIAWLSLFKAGFSALGLPPLWQAVAYSLNYGLGFVLIHIWSFTIATKQPAMTAARLASAMEGKRGRLSTQTEVEHLIVQVARTQFIAIVGNIVLAFVMATAVAWGLGLLWAGGPLMPPAKADVMLHELNPWGSLALLHAAIAGVFLYLSGVISGYYDNLCRYYKIPERLRRVGWLRGLLGVTRLDRMASYVEQHFGAMAGNFLFGCMLGSVGFVGYLLGLPIDIRHITFAMANLAYGLQAYGYDLPVAQIVWALVGVLLIGVVNLAVSFGLAFTTALRARGIERAGGGDLVWRLAKRFARRPWEFFYPPKV